MPKEDRIMVWQVTFIAVLFTIMGILDEVQGGWTDCQPTGLTAGYPSAVIEDGERVIYRDHGQVMQAYRPDIFGDYAWRTEFTTDLVKPYRHRQQTFGRSTAYRFDDLDVVATIVVDCYGCKEREGVPALVVRSNGQDWTFSNVQGEPWVEAQQKRMFASGISLFRIAPGGEFDSWMIYADGYKRSDGSAVQLAVMRSEEEDLGKARFRFFRDAAGEILDVLPYRPEGAIFPHCTLHGDQGLCWVTDGWVPHWITEYTTRDGITFTRGPTLWRAEGTKGITPYLDENGVLKGLMTVWGGRAWNVYDCDREI